MTVKNLTTFLNNENNYQGNIQDFLKTKNELEKIFQELAETWAKNFTLIGEVTASDIAELRKQSKQDLLFALYQEIAQ